MTSQAICKLYHEPGASGCKEDASCRYNLASFTNPQWAHNLLPDTSVRELHGAIVYFDHGTQIRKVSPLDGWSAFQIDGFPETTTCSQVFSYLKSIDSDLNEAGGAWIIRMLSPARNPGTRSTRVVVENTDYVNRICNKLATQYIGHRKFKATTGVMSTSDLAEAFNDPPPSLRHIDNSLSEAGDCVVCCDEVTDSISTKCGIFYCRGCWAQTCEEESKDKGFIACYGDNCNTKFGFQEMSDSLGPGTFKSILESSLKVHLRQNPKAFIECPGADCGQIYNRDTHGAITCRNQRHCKTPRFCTICEDPHPGVMCEEYANDANGTKAAMEAYMEESNTKRCQHCWEAVQLREACNHITCRCGKHWCFRCSALFDTKEKCYAHMEAVHGTIYGPVDRAPGEQVPMDHDAFGNPFGEFAPMDPGRFGAFFGNFEFGAFAEPMMENPQNPPRQNVNAIRQLPANRLPPLGIGALLPPRMAVPQHLPAMNLPPMDPRMDFGAFAPPGIANLQMGFGFRQHPMRPRGPDQELQEEARLTAIRATMQAYFAEALDEHVRAERQAVEAGANGNPPVHVNQRVQRARELRNLAQGYEHRIRRAAGLQDAEAERQDYLVRRVLLRQNANAIRQPVERVQANGPAQQQHEEERRIPIAANIQLERFLNGTLDLNIQVPDYPPRPIVNLPRQNDVAHGLPVQRNVENTPAEDENALPRPPAAVEQANQLSRELGDLDFRLMD